MLTVGSWYAMTGYGIAFPKVEILVFYNISNQIIHRQLLYLISEVQLDWAVQ